MPDYMIGLLAAIAALGLLSFATIVRYNPDRIGLRLGGSGLRGFLIAVVAIAAPVTSHAEPLHTIWRLEPITAPPTVATWNKALLDERLLPLHAVLLKDTAAPADMTPIPAGTILFEVFDEHNERAFCTLKDRSSGHTAKSLFIPLLDRRPCFLDRDGDGKLDASFGVFDKYGSVATPSGDIKSAQPMAPAAIEPADPHKFPGNYILSFFLSGKRTEAGARVRTQ